MKEEYININKVAEAKGLKSNRSLRIAIQKGKYIAREVKVNGGTSYEILYSSLEPEIQEKLENEEIKSTALVPLNNNKPQPSFISESAKLTALAKVDIIKALENMRTQYPTKKEADSIFIDLYNSGQFTTTEWTETFKKKLTLDDTSTKLSFSETVSDGRVETGSTTQDVLQALNQSTSETRSLTATDSNKNYTVGADLGETKAGTLSVVGLDGSTLDMNTNTGFELTNANTILNLTNLSIIDINDTADGKLITTTGTGSKANLKNVTIASTTNNAISNAVELNLSGTNNLGTGIVGTEGTTNITGGKTTVGSIIQNAVNITAGELEVTNITANIANAGTLTLKGTTNANAITGAGTTVIANNLTNTGSIAQAITVNGSNTFTTAANLIGGAVANGGTVELTGGALGHTISGGNITISATGDDFVTSTVANLGGEITNTGN